MGPLAIAGLVAQGAQALGGLWQGISGRKKQNDLWNNDPKLEQSQYEKDNLGLLKGAAYATVAPWEKTANDRLNQAYGEGVYNSQQASQSSLGAQQSAVDLAAKRMDAVQNRRV